MLTLLHHHYDFKLILYLSLNLDFQKLAFICESHKLDYYVILGPYGDTDHHWIGVAIFVRKRLHTAKNPLYINHRRLL